MVHDGTILGENQWEQYVLLRFWTFLLNNVHVVTLIIQKKVEVGVERQCYWMKKCDSFLQRYGTLFLLIFLPLYTSEKVF